jgi:hypothetical protein
VLLELVLSSEINSSALIASAPKFFIICSTLEQAVHGHSQFAFVILHCGMMKHLFSGPFESVERKVTSGQCIPDEIIPFYSKLLDLITSMLRDCPAIAIELRRSNFLQVVRSLISAKLVSVSLTRSLLSFPEQLVKSDSQVIFDIFSPFSS